MVKRPPRGHPKLWDNNRSIITTWSRAAPRRGDRLGDERQLEESASEELVQVGIRGRAIEKSPTRVNRDAGVTGRSGRDGCAGKAVIKKAFVAAAGRRRYWSSALQRRYSK